MTNKLTPHIEGFKQLGTLPSQLETAIKDAHQKLDAQGLFHAIGGAVNPAIEQAKAHFIEVAKLYRAEEAEVAKLKQEATDLKQKISQYKGTPQEIDSLRQKEAQLRQDYQAKEQELTRLKAAKTALEQRLSQQSTSQPTTNNQKSKLPLIIGGAIGAGALITAIALSSKDPTYEEWLTRPVQAWEVTTDKPGFQNDEHTLTVRTDQLSPPHKFKVTGQQTAEDLKRYIVQVQDSQRTTPKQLVGTLAYIAALDGEQGISDLDVHLQRAISRLQFRLEKDNTDANKKEYSCIITRERKTETYLTTVIGDNAVQALKEHFFGKVPYKSGEAKTDRETRVPDADTIILELQKMGKKIDASTVARYKK